MYHDFLHTPGHGIPYTKKDVITACLCAAIFLSCCVCGGIVGVSHQSAKKKDPTPATQKGKNPPVSQKPSPVNQPNKPATGRGL